MSPGSFYGNILFLWGPVFEAKKASRTGVHGLKAVQTQLIYIVMAFNQVIAAMNRSFLHGFDVICIWKAVTVD